MFNDNSFAENTTKCLTDSSIMSPKYVRTWHDIFSPGDIMIFEDGDEAEVKEKILMWYGTPVYKVSKKVYPERGQIIRKKI